MRKKFFTTLRNDLNGFSWAERVKGAKSVNIFEALDVEEPKEEKIEEEQCDEKIKTLESKEQSGEVKVSDEDDFPYWNFEKYSHEEIADKLDKIFEKLNKKTMDSEEQGGMVSTALNTSKSAAESGESSMP